MYSLKSKIITMLLIITLFSFVLFIPVSATSTQRYYSLYETFVFGSGWAYKNGDGTQSLYQRYSITKNASSDRIKSITIYATPDDIARSLEFGFTGTSNINIGTIETGTLFINPDPMYINNNVGTSALPISSVNIRIRLVNDNGQSSLMILPIKQIDYVAGLNRVIFDTLTVQLESNMTYYIDQINVSCLISNAWCEVDFMTFNDIQFIFSYTYDESVEVQKQIASGIDNINNQIAGIDNKLDEMPDEIGQSVVDKYNEAQEQKAQQEEQEFNSGVNNSNDDVLSILPDTNGITSALDGLNSVINNNKTPNYITFPKITLPSLNVGGVNTGEKVLSNEYKLYVTETLEILPLGVYTFIRSLTSCFLLYGIIRYFYTQITKFIGGETE